MSYNRPIITELFADLRLQQGALPFARFFDFVPQLQRNGFSVIEPGELLQVEVTSPTAEVVRPLPHRVRCWTPDRLRLVQVAPDNLVMNLVSPNGKYPGWRAFVDTVVRPAVQDLSTSIPSWRPQSVALNTIDRAVCAGSAFRLGNYLNCGGPRLPSILADNAAAFDYDVGRYLLSSDGKNRQLHINGRRSGDSYVIQIHSVFHDRLDSSSELWPVLEQLHDESNTWFESLITDRMRNEIMEGDANVSSARP